MTLYHADIEYGQLGRTTVNADTIEEAIQEATDWALNGSWESSGTVEMRVWAGPRFWDEADDLRVVSVEVTQNV